MAKILIKPPPDGSEVMSEKTREVPQLADATYAHTLVIVITNE